MQIVDKLSPHQLFKRLAAGRTPEMIAAEYDVPISAVKLDIETHVRAMGCRTEAQAVGKFVAARIKEVIPAPFHPQVDGVVAKRVIRWRSAK